MVIFEAVTLFCWLFLPVFPSPFNDVEIVVQGLMNVESWLFFSSATFTPFFVVLLMFSWVVYLLRMFFKSLVRRPVRLSLKVGERTVLLDNILDIHRVFERMCASTNISSKCSTLLFVVSVVLALVVAVYPYPPGLNPTGRFVGVDAPYYSEWIMDMDAYGTLSGAFSHAFSQVSDRPLSLFLMYLGWKTVGLSALETAQFMPVLFNPLLVLATYLFMRCAGFDSWLASLTSLFTTFSFHLTVGMYGALLSNWISLVFFYLFLGFLFWSLRKRSWRLLGMATVLQIALLFVHAYTWEMTMGILAVFFLMVFVKRLWNRGEVWEVNMGFVVLAMNFLVNVTRNFVLGLDPVSVGVAKVAQQHLFLFNIEVFWQVLGSSLGHKMGISFMNPLLLFFSLHWRVGCCF